MLVPRTFLQHKYASWAVLITGICLGISGTLGVDAVVEYTSRDEFCAHCHKDNATREWQESIHHQNRQGVVVSCSTCHIPHEFGPKMLVKIKALADVWSFYQGTISTPEKYEAKRLQMARDVWARMAERGSRECMQCHRIEAMVNPDKPFMKRVHEVADKAGKPCVECHKGMAHLAPVEPEAPNAEESLN